MDMKIFQCITIYVLIIYKLCFPPSSKKYLRAKNVYFWQEIKGFLVKSFQMAAAEMRHDCSVCLWCRGHVQDLGSFFIPQKYFTGLERLISFSCIETLWYIWIMSAVHKITLELWLESFTNVITNQSSRTVSEHYLNSSIGDCESETFNVQFKGMTRAVSSQEHDCCRSFTNHVPGNS